MSPSPLGVDLRAIRPDDLPELRAGLRRLSPDTRFQRFHAAIDDLSPAQWRYLTDVDGHDHVAFVAQTREAVGELRPGAIVGVARYIRSRQDPSRAEIAFVVWDAVQGRGVGATLRDALVSAGRARGISSFFAHVLPGNFVMRRLLASGPFGAMREDDGVFEVALADRVRTRDRHAA